MDKRIRRFDIFAIVNYLKNKKSMSDEKAKGDAIWLAKLVANRKLYGGPKKAGKIERLGKSKSGVVTRWKVLSDVPQTDEEYDKAIIDRFGNANYIIIEREIKMALENGYDYKQFRDSEEHPCPGRATGWCVSNISQFVEEMEERFGKPVSEK